MISLVSFCFAHAANSAVYKLLYFLMIHVLSGRSPSSLLKCLLAAVAPLTAVYLPIFALVSSAYQVCAFYQRLKFHYS